MVQYTLSVCDICEKEAKLTKDDNLNWSIGPAPAGWRVIDIGGSVAPRRNNRGLVCSIECAFEWLKQVWRG